MTDAPGTEPPAGAARASSEPAVPSGTTGGTDVAAGGGSAPAPSLTRWLVPLALLSALLQGAGAMGVPAILAVSPVPWALSLYLGAAAGVSLRRAFAVSALVGLVSSAHLWGIAYYSPPVYGVVLGYHALVWGGYGAFVHWSARRALGATPLVAGAAWALLETLRTFGALSFPFAFGGMLADFPWLVQSASLVGATGLSGLLFWVCFGLALALAPLLGAPRGPRLAVAAPLLVLGVALAWGALRLHRAPDAPRVRLAALQGALPSWAYSAAVNRGPFRSLLDEHYGRLLRQALERRPRLVVFPETVFDYRLTPDEAGLLSVGPLGAARLATGTALLVGASFSEGDFSRNGMAVMRAGEGGRARLDRIVFKRQLVPFIESGHRAGVDWTVLAAAGVPVGMLVCYESMYPTAGRAVARAGARLLVVASDDSGMRWSPLAWTHAEQGRLRAVENGLPMVRAGQSGPSYVTDAYGRMLAHRPMWEVGVVEAEVPLHDLRTPYRRVGSHWAWAWLVLTVAPLAVSRRARVRRRAA